MIGRIRAALASCLLALTPPAAAAAGADQPSGAIYVSTLPTGANVWVDGTYVGGTPVLVDALPPGRHALTITKSGWVVQEVDVSVTAGSVQMSSTRLVAAPQTAGASENGSIVVRDVPPGSSLYLDGAPLGSAPGRPVDLPAGPHRITLVTARGRTNRTFTVLPGTTTELVLHEAPPDSGRLAVLAPVDDYLPSDDYEIDGKKIVLRFGGHVVVAHFGEATVRYDGNPIDYDSMPETVGKKLFLPLALLEKLAQDSSKDR
jgi:hypothetical protein